MGKNGDFANSDMHFQAWLTMNSKSFFEIRNARIAICTSTPKNRT